METLNYDLVLIIQSTCAFINKPTCGSRGKLAAYSGNTLQHNLCFCSNVFQTAAQIATILKSVRAIEAGLIRVVGEACS